MSKVQRGVPTSGLPSLLRPLAGPPGIKRLEMFPPGTDGRRSCESTGVFSPDGEYLPFAGPIVTEGRPEEWLNRVEEAMFATTKKHLYKVGHWPTGDWEPGATMFGLDTPALAPMENLIKWRGLLCHLKVGAGH